MQRAAILARGDLGVGLRRAARARAPRVSVMTARSLRLEALDAIEVDRGQPLRGQLARLDPARQRGHRREGDRRRRATAAARRRRASARSDRCVDRRARCRGSTGSRASPAHRSRASATLRGPVRRSNSAAIDVRHVSSRLLPLGRRHRDLHQLLRLGEGRRRDLGPDPARCRTSAARRAERARPAAAASRRRLRLCRRPPHEEAERRANQKLTACIHD